MQVQNPRYVAATGHQTLHSRKKTLVHWPFPRPHNLNQAFTFRWIPELDDLQPKDLVNQLPPHELTSLDPAVMSHHRDIVRHRTGDLVRFVLSAFTYPPPRPFSLGTCKGRTYINGQSVSGRIASFTRSCEYPGVITSLRWLKILTQSSSGQSCRMMCMK